MIIYLSSTLPLRQYNDYLNSGDIASGYQSQKFNELLITGLSKYEDVCAISNPPFTCKRKIKASSHAIERITYNVVAGHCSKLWHKVCNLTGLFSIAKGAAKNEQVSYVISDAINVGASLSALRIAKYLGVPAIAIVTDVPDIMDKRNSLLYRLDAFLMKRYDGYILLTKAMDDIVNPRKKPMMILEGLCDYTVGNEVVASDRTKKTCLFCGQLCDDNGIMELIKAFICANVPNTELHLYGNGDRVEDIKQMGKQHPNICYCGVVTNKEMVQRQKNADLLINPRPTGPSFTHYSFPSKLIEYLASGTATLSTRLPGIPDEYYPYMYFIADNENDSYTQAIRTCLMKSREELRSFGLAAQKWAIAEKNNIKQAQRVMEFAKLLL